MHGLILKQFAILLRTSCGIAGVSGLSDHFGPVFLTVKYTHVIKILKTIDKEYMHQIFKPYTVVAYIPLSR